MFMKEKENLYIKKGLKKQEILKKDLMILKTANSISNIYSVSDKEVLQKLSEISTKDRLLDIIYKLSDLENELKW